MQCVLVSTVTGEEGVRTASGLSFLGLPYELWVGVPFLVTPGPQGLCQLSALASELEEND